MTSMKKILYFCVVDVLLVLVASLTINGLMLNKKKEEKVEYSSISIRICNENERL